MAFPGKNPVSVRRLRSFAPWRRLALLLPLCLASCRTAAPLPRVNLSEPGWTVRLGEAVWRIKRSAPEIAGELLLATHLDGRAFVQFTKTPFPFVVAQITGDAWQIESPTRNERRTRRGAPPERLLWFQLPRAVAGSTLPKNWSWQNSGGRWRLENRSTGESLEGFFRP